VATRISGPSIATGCIDTAVACGVALPVISDRAKNAVIAATNSAPTNNMTLRLSMSHRAFRAPVG
jgi:hypothetical protein